MPEVIKEAINTLELILSKENVPGRYELSTRSEGWQYSTEEEFFADYRKGFQSASILKMYDSGHMGIFQLSADRDGTSVSIGSANRADVEKVFAVLESNVEKCRLPETRPKKRQRPKIKVFIGHGHNRLWIDLKDHLHEKHGLDVEHYERGARAGLTIKEVLDEMLTESSFALLVLTGEDQDAEGKLHARENVIHELGLFQGRLGWRKAITLIEEGVEEFSNIHGINQIRFKKGNIQETFGEVLATIKREFPEKE